MAFSTRESPVYGGGELLVEFNKETPLSSHCCYYLVFDGSKQRHVTTAKLLSPLKLQAIIPGHSEPEEVHVNVVHFHDNTRVTLASEAFTFQQDGALYLAEFLRDSVCSACALEDLELIKSEHFNLADEDLSTLDERLCRALLYVKFPDWWTILGDQTQSDTPEPRESLLHFTARLGLTKVTTFFLRKPGSEATLKLHNKKGHLPRDVALDKGFNGLAELLSEYNLHSLPPLDQWVQTERGLVQTQVSGDVTLTSDLHTHNRSIEEDIIVLQGVQARVQQADVNVARAWQTDWPEQTNNTDATSHSADTADETFKAICEKAKELPGLVSLDDRPDGADSSSDPNFEPGNHGNMDDNVEMSEDCDVAMETEQLPQLHMSEDEIEGIMGDSITALHEYHEQLQRIREKSTVFNRILEQKYPCNKTISDLRKENLSRFSSSCPSLDAECRHSPLPVIDEADFRKSMVDLADDNAQETSGVSCSSSLYSSGDPFSSNPNIDRSEHPAADGVHIVVDRASIGGSQEFGLQTQEYDSFLKEYYGGNIPQVRQRCASPLAVSHSNDTGQESSMLIHGNKSSPLMPGEDDTDDDSFRSREDVSGSDGYLSTGTDSFRRVALSAGDITDVDHTDSVKLRNHKNASEEDVGRGQVNKARYSADIEQLMRQTKGSQSGTSLDTMMTQSTHSTGEPSMSQSRDTLGMPDNRKITKALSMSSIPAATNAADKHRGLSHRDKQTPSYLLIQKLIADHDAQFHRQDEIEEEDSGYHGYHGLQSSPSRHKKTQMSLYDFLNDSSNFADNTSNVLSQKAKEKEEKKRKTSMFSRLQSSYRIKKNKEKEGKESKSKYSSHRFVAVSFSNSTTCDVCHKPLTNKPALRCQICLVNVHESSCKEHISACDKFKSKSQVPRQSSAESESIPANHERNSTTGVSILRPSYSFKDNSSSSRPHSAYTGASTQPVPVTTATIQPEVAQSSASAQLQRRSLPTPRIMIDSSHVDGNAPRPAASFCPRTAATLKVSNVDLPPKVPRVAKATIMAPESACTARRDDTSHLYTTSPNTGTYLQWRRASISVDRAIAEENEGDHGSRLDLGHNSSFVEAANMSRSIESLDEVDSVADVRLDDVELGSLEIDEPETWSETVDKKTLKKMNPKDVKRQDTIWELIQTERHYCKRLKTLQLMYRDGIRRELLHMPSELADRMFPHLDDLTTMHMNFLRQLQDLQNRRPDRLVEEIGPALTMQFSGETSKQMKRWYGVFCSRHTEILQLYKDLLAKDRKFNHFIRMRSNHPLCKKREISDFYLIITQRLTKYPIMIEAIIKNTRDKRDRESLGHAANSSKEVLHEVDNQVAAAERALRLRDICNRMEGRTFGVHRSKKFRKSDMHAHNRKLLYEGMIGWKNARNKAVDVLAVVLTDVLIFLQDNGGKYAFFSQDNKFGVVSLFNLLVREKRDTRDTKGIYLISQDKQNPEMYEIVFNTTTDMQAWAKVLRAAVEQCPEEEEEVVTEADKERQRQEERYQKAQDIMERLHKKDEEIRRLCEDKNRLMGELLAVYSDTDDAHHMPVVSGTELDMLPAGYEGTGGQLEAALHEVSSQLATMLQTNSSNLSRSVSSVGEHSSNTFNPQPMPKRAETFGGFDNHETKVVKKAAGVDQSDSTADSPQTSMYKEREASDPELNTLTDPTLILHKCYDSESESGRGSSPSGFSGATMSPMSSVSLVSSGQADHSNIAHILKTLNKIVTLTTSQSTAVETLRAQLHEANERINKLSADVHEKKSGYRHNQLEELRNFHGVIQKEKEDWEQKKLKDERSMKIEHEQLDERKQELNRQEAEIKQHREKLNKEREVLQRQMDLLRQSGQLPRDTSLSDLAADGNTDKLQPTTTFVPGHKRSASAESFGSTKDDSASRNGKTPSGSVSQKENNFRPENKSVTKLQSFSYGSNKQNLPVHLLSATNEQKIGSKNVQQLPSKLSGGGLVSSSPQQTTTQTGSKSSNMSANQSSPALSQDSGSAAGGNHMGHSASMGQLGNQVNSQNQYGSSVSVPMAGYQSNRPKPSAAKVPSLSGVLKLAEKGEKKSKSGSSSHLLEKLKEDKTDKGEPSGQQRPKSGTPGDRNPKSLHKSQKSDSDVIYF